MADELMERIRDAVVAECLFQPADRVRRAVTTVCDGILSCLDDPAQDWPGSPAIGSHLLAWGANDG